MLKYVVFAVTEKGRQVLDRSRAELEQVFTGEKTEFVIVSAAQTEEGILRLRMEESLILTDDPAYLKALQAAGFIQQVSIMKKIRAPFLKVQLML